jgi:ElaB/YqjD/DUF883 family membrane-anchored ribosome-binding protein
MAQSNSSTAKSKVSAQDTGNHPVADKIKDSLHESVDTLAEKAADAERGIRESAVKGSENFEKRRDQIEANWNSSAVKRYAVENPVKTAGLAFAAGALLASMLRNK